MTVLTIAMSLGLGILSWSFAEYALHSGYAHRAKGRNRFSREHLKHHSNGLYFAASREKALAGSVAFAATTPAAIWIAGVAHGLCFAGAFACTYLTYEYLHRRVHTHAPRTAYGQWMRRHHLHHHYTRPRENHGVTSPLWDHVFRTRIPAGIVRVPEKRICEVAWLIGDDGEVKPEYAGHYVIARPQAARIARKDQGLPTTIEPC